PATADPVLTVRAAPTVISPNGDGRKERTTVKVAVAEPVSLDVAVLDGRGRTLRVLLGHASVTSSAAVVWNGRDAGGARVPDGRYRLVVTATDDADVSSSASGAVRVDTVAPRLAWRGGAGIVRARALRVPFEARDRSHRLAASFRVVGEYGHVKRRWKRRLSPGSGAVRLGRPAVLRTTPGVYRLTGAIEDVAGNRSRLHASPPYRLDHGAETRILARVENAGRYVALTFDDCVFESSWQSILETLERAHVKAAFFCPGAQVRAHPSLAARTVSAGHTLGSHGWDHGPLHALGYGAVLWRLLRDRDIWWRWRAAATPYFRPVGGAYNPTVLAAAGAAGYRYTVLWDVDPRDWTDPGVGAIVARAVGSARPGSVILLHVKPQTAAALRLVVHGLRRRALRPIALDDLVHRPHASASLAGWHPRAAQGTALPTNLSTALR
ncbi:MAG: polysaccharide deacetylase family protein, partial [Thermoleophilia bacterium]|nr:polysaccharide deacetylase family protein [Thermoleophilia bacterium]